MPIFAKQKAIHAECRENSSLIIGNQDNDFAKPHALNQSKITMNEKNTVADVTETGNPSINNAVKRASRRKFLGQVGAALTGGIVLGKASLASAQSDASGDADGVQLPDSVTDPRVKKSFAIRVKTATKEALYSMFRPTRPTGMSNVTRTSPAPTPRAFSKTESGW